MVSAAVLILFGKMQRWKKESVESHLEYKTNQLSMPLFIILEKKSTKNQTPTSFLLGFGAEEHYCSLLLQIPGEKKEKERMC